MISPERTKPVKAAAPESTIRSVRNIVSFLRCDTMLHDNSASEMGFYATNLVLLSMKSGKPLFMCNGKGMSPQLASASAYGELIERLQNLAWYMATVYFSEPENTKQQPSLSFGFRYTPDERICTSGELVAMHPDILRKLFLSEREPATSLRGFIEQTMGWSQLTCVPFTNLRTNESVLLPFRFVQWIVGSNGMCAGNTREEALIQGICEVFERYVMKCFYTEPFTPPSIPLELFYGQEILSRIETFEKKYRVSLEVKDCSLGMGYPVLGTLIRDHVHSRYAFHLGADPCPVTALERCLAEHFQCDGGVLVPFGQGEFAGPASDADDGRKRQFHRTITSYSGAWPSALFRQTPDYQFTGFEHPISCSDQDDLMWLLELMDRNSLDLLVRDTSFLGMPSYYTYIPGMSEITTIFGSGFLEALSKFERELPLFYILDSASPSTRSHVSRLVDEVARKSYSGEFLSYTYFQHNNGLPTAGRNANDIGCITPGAMEVTSGPTCFNCTHCQNSESCSYLDMREVWESIKSAMKARAADGACS